MNKVFHIHGVEALAEVSDQLISMRNEADVIAFYGSMGAGKTTLIKNLCHRMGGYRRSEQSHLCHRQRICHYGRRIGVSFRFLPNQETGGSLRHRL